MTTNKLPTDISRGDALRDSGALDEAIVVYKQAISASPELALGHYKLGTALTRLARTEEAEASYREALRLQPTYAEAANNLGILLAGRGEFDYAETLYRNALSEQIDYFDAHLNLGNLLAKEARKAEALYHYRRAIGLNPAAAPAWENLGILFHDLGRIADSISALNKAIEIDPARPHAWANLARCHLVQGQVAAADQCNQKAISLDDALTGVWQNIVLSTNYRSGSRREAFLKHLAFGDHLARMRTTDSIVGHGNALLPHRRLRVGFVSGDLRRHSVSHFIEGPLSQIDPQLVELWAYYNYPVEDFRTQELRPLFAEWQNIYGVKDGDVTEMIRRDQIDILVDLSGPTGHARMRVFAEKPAPIQVNWIGYPNTTGLAAMDYRFTDGWADPVGDAEPYHSETLVRLPDCFLCYSPPRNAPAISTTPHLQRGYITFGSFNTRVKIGEETLALWGRAMSAAPQSRLMIKSVGGFSDPAVRKELLDQIEKAGIDPNRVTLQTPEQALADHLALYRDIDIALDTHPYHGTTTTCEALWMGVPVITLAGDRHASRVGVSLLRSVGLQELIATTPDEYAHIAATLAADSERLTELRSSMRQRLQSSPLLDGQAMARKLEQAFRQMWSIYCNQHAEDAAPQSPVEPNRYIVNMHGDYKICVAPDTVSSLTTWVALEQEDWFEDEIRFVRKLCSPTWQALDVGANHGVYALSLASSGAAQVWAFEPTSEPRLRLRDCVALNDFEDRIHVIPQGLSSLPRSLDIVLSQHCESNSIHAITGQMKGRETISLVTLDGLIGNGIPENALIDFVKLSAEGEEAAILRGGLRFFCAQSPLVMFEYKHGNVINDELIDTFRAMGYGIFRLLPALDCLIPVSRESQSSLSPFTLNLFACKDDRANLLESGGHLLTTLPGAVPALNPAWLPALAELPAFSPDAVAQWASRDFNSDYGRALLAWCGSRLPALAADQRYALLAQALEHFQAALGNEDSHPAVAVLGIRICSDIGMRVEALNIAKAFLEQMEPEEEFPLDRPVPPAYGEFDHRRPHTNLGCLLYQSVLEFFLDRGAHSQFFWSQPDDLVPKGLASPERTPRLERGAWLKSARKGDRLQLGAETQLFSLAGDNLNPALWQELLRSQSPKTDA